jgi:cation:H+ antiporter
MGLAFDALRLLLGGVLLYFGAEWLVKGAAGLAAAFRVKPLVIGMTVVAYGTSAPELTVSVAASLEGKSEIALANAIGSNIANLGLILGLTALISPPRVEAGLIRRVIPVLILSALLPVGLLYDGVIDRVDAFALLAGALIFTFWMLRAAKGPSTQTAESAVADAEKAGAPVGTGKLWMGVVAAIGLVLLVGGGKVFVDGAVGVAIHAGMSDRVVGLTIVAIGTSSLVAALRKQSAIAVGNVVGSNIFNVLLILGGAGIVRPIEASLRALRLDLGMLVGMTLLGAAAIRSERDISRIEGAVLMIGYGVFLIAIATGVS